MIKAYIDASTKGNPGPSGGGIVLLTPNMPQRQLHFPFETFLTNHQAEMATFNALLDLFIQEELTQETILVYSDSKILVKLIQDNYTKNAEFRPFLTEMQEKLRQFVFLEVQWLPEAQNKGADHLARQGLQKALKLQNRRK